MLLRHEQHDYDWDLMDENLDEKHFTKGPDPAYLPRDILSMGEPLMNHYCKECGHEPHKGVCPGYFEEQVDREGDRCRCGVPPKVV